MSPATDTGKRHLTPTERLHEVTMQALSRPPSAPENMVELSRNAKGDFQFTVAVRGPDADACYDTALRLVGELRAAFPHSSETNGGES